MNTKTLLLSFCMLALTFVSLAQENKSEPKIYKPSIEQYDFFAKEVYGNNVENKLYKNSRKNNFYKDLFKNRLTIIKTNDAPNFYYNLSEVPVYNKNLAQALNDNFDPTKFNPFNYKLDYFNSKEKLYYQIDNTNFYIAIEKYNAEDIKK